MYYNHKEKIYAMITTITLIGVSAYCMIINQKIIGLYCLGLANITFGIYRQHSNRRMKDRISDLWYALQYK